MIYSDIKRIKNEYSRTNGHLINWAAPHHVDLADMLVHVGIFISTTLIAS